VEGSCEQGIEPSGSIKRWEVLEWLHIKFPTVTAYIVSFRNASLMLTTKYSLR
jgi:hypothetical protein